MINSKAKYSLIMFKILTIFLVFELALRTVINNNIINLIKVVLTLLMIFLNFNTNNFNKTWLIGFVKRYYIICTSFIILILLIIIKLTFQTTFEQFLEWLKVNNNVNYMFYFLYFLSIIGLDLENEVYTNLFNYISYVIIILAFYSFLSNNYFGTVSYDTLIDYRWAGIDKSRMMSIAGNPNHAGLIFVLLLFITDYYRIVKKKSIVCINSVLLAICNVLTFSRTSIIIMAIYFALRPKIAHHDPILNKLKINKIQKILLVIFGVLFVLIIIQKFNIYFFKPSYLLTSDRLIRWAIGIRAFSKNIALGNPFDIRIEELFREKLVTFSDNMFIEVGVYFGIIAFIFVVGWIIYYFIISVKGKQYLVTNKIQILIISWMLSGAIHFSIPLFLYIFYFFKCTEVLIDTKI